MIGEPKQSSSTMELSPLAVLKHCGNAIADVKAVQDNEETFLITCYQKYDEIDIWNLTTRRVEKSFKTGDESGNISVNMNHKTIAVCSKEGNIKIFEGSKSNYQPTNIICLNNIGFCKPSYFECYDKFLMAAPKNQSKSISLFDMKTFTESFSIDLGCCVGVGMVLCIKLFEYDGVLSMLTGFEDGSIAFWNVENNKLISRVELVDKEPILCVDFDVKLKRGVCGSPTEVINKFSIETNEQMVPSIIKRSSVPLSNPGVSDLKIRPDGKLLAVASWDYSVKIFSWAKVRPLAVLKYHNSTVQSVAFISLKQGKYLCASASSDGKIAIWDIYNNG